MKISRGHVITGLLLLGVLVEATSALEWAAYPYFPDKSLLFARIDASILNALAPFSPTLLILLLYTWPIVLAASLNNRFSKRFRSYLTWLAKPLLQVSSRVPSNSQARLALTNRPRLLLLLAIAAAALLGIVPYRPDLNPSMNPVGVDAHFYVDAVSQMLQRTPESAISYALGNVWASSRPLLLVPMYLAALTGLVSVNQTVEALPAILGPLLAMSTFVLVREGSGSEPVAAIASIFSALSFTATVGMWAGFYANWLALSLAYLFLAVFLSFLRESSRSKFIAMTLLSVSLLLAHPWTWLLTLTIGIIFMATIWRYAGKAVMVKPFVILLAINIIIDLARSQVFGGPVATQDASASLSQSGISQTLNFWPNILSGLFSAYGGLLGNAILLALSVITMLFLRFENKFERVLTLWVVTGSIPFLFVSSLIQTRIIYDMPLPIMASAALFFLIRPLRSSPTNCTLAALLLILLTANYALRAVTNLVSPPF